MVCGHLNVPHTVGIGWVGVWVVGAAEEASWTRKEAPTGCRDRGESSEVKRGAVLFFWTEPLSGLLPRCHNLRTFLEEVSLVLTSLVWGAHACLLLLCRCWGGGGAGRGDAGGGPWALCGSRWGCSLQLWGQEDGVVAFSGVGSLGTGRATHGALSKVLLPSSPRYLRARIMATSSPSSRSSSRMSRKTQSQEKWQSGGILR